MPDTLLARDVVAPLEPSAELQQILIEVYRKDTKNAELCERLVDLDEGVQEWRYRHVKMVRANDRRQAGHRRLGGRRVSARNGRPADLPGSLGDTGTALTCPISEFRVQIELETYQSRNHNLKSI